MSFTIFNKSDLDMSQMRPLLKSFMPFAQKKIGFDRPVSINFVSDLQNANLPLGKTGYYDPNNSNVCIYTDKRHPKDIMRSLSHELVHHGQNCRGEFDRKPEMGEGYFQRDGDMRELEREAYEKGNMCFREWEETYKKQLQESIYYQTGDTKMSLKEWKDQELFDRLLENYGYKKPEPECITHLCAMQVKELASGRIGHPINHTLLEDGTVTHYDVEFDNVIVEGMPVSALETTVLETHGHVARREDNPHGDKPREQYMEEEEALEEEKELEEGEKLEEEELDEGEAKPDFLDLDKDGDKDEPMKAAAEELDEAKIREFIRGVIKKKLGK